MTSNISFNILGTDVYPHVDLSDFSVDLSYKFIEYDALLTITTGNDVFFQEYIAVFELYAFLREWINLYNKQGVFSTMQYETIEYHMSILSFEHKDCDDKIWIVDSIWKKIESAVEVEFDTLLSEVNSLLITIEKLAGQQKLSI